MPIRSKSTIGVLATVWHALHTVSNVQEQGENLFVQAQGLCQGRSAIGHGHCTHICAGAVSGLSSASLQLMTDDNRHLHHNQQGHLCSLAHTVGCVLEQVQHTGLAM